MLIGKYFSSKNDLCEFRWSFTNVDTVGNSNNSSYGVWFGGGYTLQEWEIEITGIIGGQTVAFYSLSGSGASQFTQEIEVDGVRTTCDEIILVYRILNPTVVTTITAFRVGFVNRNSSGNSAAVSRKNVKYVNGYSQLTNATTIAIGDRYLETPTDLFRLQNLTSLTWSSQDITTIDPRFAFLSNLTSLSLDMPYTQGDSHDEDTLKGLANLTTLTLTVSRSNGVVTNGYELDLDPTFNYPLTKYTLYAYSGIVSYPLIIADSTKYFRNLQTFVINTNGAFDWTYPLISDADNTVLKK